MALLLFNVIVFTVIIFYQREQVRGQVEQRSQRELLLDMSDWVRDIELSLKQDHLEDVQFKVEQIISRDYIEWVHVVGRNDVIIASYRQDKIGSLAAFPKHDAGDGPCPHCVMVDRGAELMEAHYALELPNSEGRIRNRETGMLRLGVSLSVWLEESYREVFLSSLQYMFVVVVATALMGLWLKVVISNRIEALHHFAQGIDIGHIELFQQTSEVNDEIYRLGEAFNGMIRRLNESIQDLNHAKMTAEEANQAKRSFLSTMSHEMRSPLNVIIGYSSHLQESDLDDETKDIMGRITLSGSVLLGLIDDVLDLAKVESGKLILDLQPFRLSNMIKTLLHVMEEEASEKGFSLAFEDTSVDEDVYLGDAQYIKQIVLNLLSNAVKYSAKKGEILVALKVLDRSEDGSEKVRLEVSDPSPPLSKDVIDQLFDTFERAEYHGSDQPKGAGLGLSVCRKLARYMGGDVGACVGEGGRNAFYVELRLERVELNEIPPCSIERSSQPISESFEGRRILVVDDDEDNWLLMKTLLKKMKCQSTWASSGEEAIEFLDEGKTFDLIFMDLRMPGLNGIQTTKLILADPKKADNKIVALTAQALSEDRDKCLEVGMVDYLSKPLSASRLREHLDMVLKEA